jgi:VIT1/CCC1 family predicted Fe2+/Mn2+ transporter
MDHDALGAHARDELGIVEEFAARPLQAAVTSAGSFVLGAGLPLLVALWVPLSAVIWAVSFSALLFLALLGALGASAGGAPVLKAAIRVCFWGALAMLLTALVGHWFA